jgi:hypothetical protein
MQNLQDDFKNHINYFLFTQKELQIQKLIALRQLILNESYTLTITTNTSTYNLNDYLTYNVDTTLLVMIDESIDKLQKDLIFLHLIN